MKKRFTGRVRGGSYEVLDPNGGVVKTMTIAEAREHPKLASAIDRNGWDAIPEE